MKVVEHTKMPSANGHYSMCTEHNGFLFISGQLPLGEERQIPEGIKAQTSLVLKKLETILKAAHSDLDKLLSVRIYIPDVELWDQVNEVYAEFMGAARPARCVVPTGRLHYGCLIELEAVAHV